jgi:hypothetical protein
VNRSETAVLETATWFPPLLISREHAVSIATATEPWLYSTTRGSLTSRVVDVLSSRLNPRQQLLKQRAMKQQQVPDLGVYGCAARDSNPEPAD